MRSYLHGPEPEVEEQQVRRDADEEGDVEGDGLGPVEDHLAGAGAIDLEAAGGHGVRGRDLAHGLGAGTGFFVTSSTIYLACKK